MPGGSVYYPNPPAKGLLFVIPLAILLGVLIMLPLFLGIYGNHFAYVCLPAVYILLCVLTFALLSNWLITSIIIGQDYVLLRYPLRRKKITPSDVSCVKLDPHTESDSLQWQWIGYRISKCRIDFENGETLPIAYMPNGLMLRIARVLDPENFPPPTRSPSKVE